MNLPSKNWAKRIQEEWKILENDLPDTIFVRVYESRMDLLRAVIIGAEGTPYYDGLFSFDVFFPSGYLNVPPVCPSLLNTWSGNKNEKWIPSMSTMLQVLVFIQVLILNQKPYFNEPGYASWNATVSHKPRNKSSKLTLRASLPLPARAEGFETLYRANIHCIDSEGVQYRFCRSI
ncbi:hypothetical protein JRO89_XS03G0143900 [Xanthoceras sorbifolium]|uniref:UBC core domain-containing protein n=1 Tax=Xanthoceras sorbifolium TaxID=99658 RepID=A0ABQ8I9U4_9ROSI|nr:hypothetical protein JRO89_XS03G0143900 [Xanthoceras sorbifolium]